MELADNQLLQGMSAQSAEHLLSGARHVRLQAGDWLFREGDAANSAFIVRSGRLAVTAGEEAIRDLKRGALIGELALLTRSERSASVRALRDSELLEINRDSFEQIVLQDHRFSWSLCSLLAGQLAANRSPPSAAEPPRTVAIMALDADMLVDPVANRLAEELASAGHATVLRPQAEPDAANYRAVLDRARSSSRWLLLTTAAGPADPWTQLCLAEADRIVVLTRGRPAREWRETLAPVRGCELLIVGHDAPEGLVSAVAPRTVQTLADERAVQRCIALGARRLAGSAVGIVLSGGGARAFAHLGVIEELRRAGLRIDRVAGTSMGALVAGAVAVEMDDAAIYESVRRSFVEQNPSGDYTLPAYSLIRGRRTRRLLERAFGATRIEQLPLRFFCVSADLNSRSLVVHRTGPMADAIFASLAIPGVFPPIPTPDGRLLVDGGVLDNLPVETMARDNEGPVIAVDVTHAAPWQPSEHSWRSSRRVHIRSLISGQRAELPRLGETMLRTLAVGSRDTVAAGRRHADLVITPEVDDTGLLDWKQLPRMREAGRTAVRRLLERSPEALERYL